MSSQALVAWEGSLAYSTFVIRLIFVFYFQMCSVGLMGVKCYAAHEAVAFV